MKFAIILLISYLMLLSGCDVDTPEDASTGEIMNGLDKIETAFNYHHIEEIMQYYNNEYMHNGEDIDNVTLDWEIRLNDYQEMELSNIVIDLNDSRATVSLTRRFYINGEKVLEENLPQDDGDLSYWELDVNDWKIAGNGISY